MPGEVIQIQNVNLVEYNKYTDDYCNKIEIGNSVKVAISCNGVERFWTKVFSINQNNTIIGKIDNIIQTVDDLKKNDLISINIKNVYDHHDNEYIAIQQARIYQNIQSYSISLSENLKTTDNLVISSNLHPGAIVKVYDLCNNEHDFILVAKLNNNEYYGILLKVYVDMIWQLNEPRFIESVKQNIIMNDLHILYNFGIECIHKIIGLDQSFNPEILALFL